MTKVGLITTFPSREAPVGGVATYAKSLVGALEEGGGPPVIVFGQRHPPPERSSAVPAWEFGWSFQESLQRSLDEHPVDLVHVQHEPFLFGTGAAALPVFRLPHLIRRRGLACVMTLHAVPFPSLLRNLNRATTGIRTFSILYLRALRWIRNDVDRFVVHELEQAESLKEFARISEDSIAVIPHGVEVAERSLSLPSERPFTIGTFGFLTPYKDPDFVLNEFHKLRCTLPAARLRFSLSPHPRRRDRRSERRYRDIMRRAESIEGVEALRHIPEANLHAFLAACDVVVLPYRYAVASSGVAARAIGSGTPVLLPEGSGTIARLDGWSFRYAPGGLAAALARQSERLYQMNQQLCLLVRDCSWQRVADLHRFVYD